MTTERDRVDTTSEDYSQYSKDRRINKVDDPGDGAHGNVPNLQSRIVVGVFQNRRDVEAARQDLLAAGLDSEHISIVAQPSDTAPETSADDTKSDSGTVIGATAGTILGVFVGLAALAVPGVGPILAVGPLAAALGGAAVGGTLGALAGAFAGLGIPTEKAKEYEAAVRSGGIVITVKGNTDAEAQRAEEVLGRYGSSNVSSYNESL